MSRPGFACFLSCLPLVLTACGSGPSPPRLAVATRAVGSWHGAGNSTIGFVSDSGRFRVTWQTLNERSVGGGTFRLAVHSAVSGRAIQLITDRQGSGAADVSDDPRPYNLMVESANVDWSISVEEVVATTERR